MNLTRSPPVKIPPLVGQSPPTDAALVTQAWRREPAPRQSTAELAETTASSDVTTAKARRKAQGDIKR